MPQIVAWVIGALVTAAGTLVGKVLLSLGIGYAVYSGIDTSIAWAKSEFLAGVGGLPSLAVQVAGTLKVGVCVSLLLSALTTRVVMQGMVSGAMKRMVQK